MPGISRVPRYMRDLSVLIIGAVAGGLVTHYSQLSIQHEKLRHELVAEERAGAEAVCRTLSRSMDTRMSSMRSILQAYEQERPVSYRRQKWAGYSRILEEWNNSLNDNALQISRYFGPRHRDTFEMEIQAAFRRAGRDLEDIGAGRVKPTSARLAAIREELDFLNGKYRLFLDTLMGEVTRGNVGAVRQ
jgi:hypothetical protein